MPAPESTDIPDRFSLRLFGPFAAEIGGEPMPRLRYRSSQWLLALLILRHPRAAGRRDLAALLWPDSDESNALFYLRRSASDLRHALGASAFRLLSPTPRSLRFDLTGIACDVTAFDRAIADGSETALQNAVSLYQGVLLEGCNEEWIETERRNREQAFLTALETLGERALDGRRDAEAAPHLRRLVASDPYRESAQCRLMEALARMGDHAAVTAAFREFRLRLHHDLNTAPNPETIALYQRLQRPRAIARSLPPAHPPALTLNPPPPCRLPRPLTDLIGREDAIEQVAGLLSRARLLTLTGTGGVGKTRLAIAVGEAASEAFASGVWFVDLAALTDGALVAQAVARALDAREEAEQPLETTLRQYLADKSLLLLLDNCEHLLDACARLAVALLEHCPHLRILATSRQPLGVTGERVWRVPPLLPPPADMQAARDKNGLAIVLESPAARLFVERIAAADADFRLEPPDAVLIADICRRLDGLPLALELAAARAHSIGLQGLQMRLDHGLHLLTQGSRAAQPRQQTLRALLNWSYDLLSPPEQMLLKRLSVFRGGWTLEAAEAVCGEEEKKRGREEEKQDVGNAEMSISAWEVLDLLTSLLDRSLVVMEAGENAPRYRLLETVRQYAQEKLAPNERAETQARHGAYYLQLAADTRPRLAGPEQAQAFAVLDAEQDNLRAALDVCEQAQDAEGAHRHLSLAAALGLYWWKKGYWREGRARLEQALARPETPDTLRARLDALNDAGLMAHDQGDMDAAERLLTACLALARSHDDKRMMAKALNNLGIAAKSRAEFALARQRHEASLALKREMGDTRAIAMALHNLGSIAISQGDLAAAFDFFQQSMSMFEQLQDTQRIATSLSSQSRLAIKHGDYGKAQALRRRSLTIQHRFEDGFAIVIQLYDVMNLALHLEQWERAARLLGAADSLRQSLGMQVLPLDVEFFETTRARLRDALGLPAFEAAQAAGRLLARDEAIEYALSE